MFIQRIVFCRTPGFHVLGQCHIHRPFPGLHFFLLVSREAGHGWRLLGAGCLLRGWGIRRPLGAVAAGVLAGLSFFGTSACRSSHCYPSAGLNGLRLVDVRLSQHPRIGRDRD